MKKNDKKKINTELPRGGNLPKIALYARAAKYAPEAINKLAYLMRKGDNDNVRMAAAKTLLAKVLPDLSAAELTGAHGEQLQFTFRIDLAGGYIPPLGAIITTPGTGYPRSTPLQSIGLAQTGKENNNSPN